jgi:DNA-binding response OmpR family regulator
MSHNFQEYSAINSVSENDLTQDKQAGISPSLVEDHEVTDGGDWLRDDGLALSPGLRKATYGEAELRLTSAEFNILEHLLRNRGSVLTREELVRAALGRHLGALDRSVDVHISRLRKKIIESGAGGTHIKAIRGVGYIYAALPSNGHS